MVPSPKTLDLPEVEGHAVGDGFQVSLANFDGPFDLLLSLISSRELDITEVSLGAVTDELRKTGAHQWVIVDYQDSWHSLWLPAQVSTMK